MYPCTILALPTSLASPGVPALNEITVGFPMILSGRVAAE